MRKTVTNRHIVAILAVLFAALFALASCSGDVAEPESTSADYVAEAVGSESESETETVTEEQTTAAVFSYSAPGLPSPAISQS